MKRRSSRTDDPPMKTPPDGAAESDLCTLCYREHDDGIVTLSWHDRIGKRIGSKDYPNGAEALRAAHEEFGVGEGAWMLDEAPYCFSDTPPL
jgi:hypothetical protein